VQDAAYMITVPLMVRGGKPLLKPVVFLYMSDGFQKPMPFSQDIVVDVTPVIDKKLDAFCTHASQFFEWMPWNEGWLNDVPVDPEQRRKVIEDRYLTWSKIDNFRKGAKKWYSSAQLKNIRYVEAFEICEYGHKPDKEEIKRLFPMLPQ
jgi:LmbE family N-acetylglucosaminyl deacetylase